MSTVFEEIRENVTHKQTAVRHKLIFNGMQQFPEGKKLPMFTSTEYGTFVVMEGETIEQAMERKEKQFRVASTSPVAKNATPPSPAHSSTLQGGH